MTIYYVFFLILFLMSFAEICGIKIANHSKRIMLSFFFVVFIFLSTIYYGPVGDSYKYKWYFGVVKFEHIAHPIEPFEKGYIFLNALIRIFTDKYWILRLVQAIITIGTWKHIIMSKDFDYVFGKEFISLLCLWSFMQGNIFIARSSIAVVVCIYSVKYIEQKKFRAFVLCMLVAFLFHSLTIVFFPAYWLYHWRGSRKYMYMGVIGAAVLSTFLPQIVVHVAEIIPVEYFQIKISHYVDDIGLISYTNYSYTFTKIKALVNMIVSIIAFEFMSRMTDRLMGKFEGCLNLYTLGVLIYFVAINVSTGMTRAALPYMNLQIIMLPQMFNISVIKNNLNNRMVVFLIFSVYLFARMFLNIQGQEYTTMFSH